MGIENYQLASALLLIIAQRLVRKCCRLCQHGCKSCYQGFLGRTGVYELLPITEEIRSLMLMPQALLHIKKYLNKQSWISLAQHGEEKISEGITSRDEIERILGKEFFSGKNSLN
jgi:type II secretory ATPase GspE/PulE/Tfp pilus assembly ATPase PilB-like protein